MVVVGVVVVVVVMVAVVVVVVWVDIWAMFLEFCGVYVDVKEGIHVQHSYIIKHYKMFKFVGNESNFESLCLGL